MKRLKRVFALVFSLIFIIGLIQPQLLVKAESKSNEKVYVKIRYDRPDKNYEGWNLWVTKLLQQI